MTTTNRQNLPSTIRTSEHPFKTCWFKKITDENSQPTPLQIVIARMIIGVVQTSMTGDVLIAAKRLIFVKTTKYWVKRQNNEMLKNFTVLNSKGLSVPVLSKLEAKLPDHSKERNQTLRHKLPLSSTRLT